MGALFWTIYALSVAQSINRTLLLLLLYKLDDMAAMERRVLSVKLIVLAFINITVWWSPRRHIRLFHNVRGIMFTSIRTVMILAWESAYNSDPTVPNGNQLPVCVNTIVRRRTAQRKFKEEAMGAWILSRVRKSFYGNILLNLGQSSVNPRALIWCIRDPCVTIANQRFSEWFVRSGYVTAKKVFVSS